ncbi:MAG: methylated-DNA--[protein]-cysteine S-methyltransferase [Candidatus Altiarchaeota archaeon]|nr:methylated-DNA--[protein]-cysteine S-methyltransferase [Candidatus Altiarchaeota archaeon]
MNLTIGLAWKQLPDNLEVGIISSGGKILFSAFSFNKKVNERLSEHIKKQNFTHSKNLDANSSELLDYALKGEDVFDWSILSKAQFKVLNKLYKTRKVTTYGELAKSCNTGPRAVGKIMNTNPFAYFVPCHRVLAKNGVGGFAHDLSEKLKLLQIES